MQQIAATKPIQVLAIAVATLGAALAAGLAVSSGVADGANTKAEIIGPVTDRAKSSCPGKDCSAFGHVTGYQMRTANQTGVHKVRSDGHVVAWSVDLGTIGDEATLEFFETNLEDATFDRYGGSPVANLAVLKDKGKGKFKLAKQSPIVELENHLGGKPIFTLRKPLKVKKGQILALSTPTWVTNFAEDRTNGKSLGADNKWRASRRASRCEAEDLDDNGKIDGTKEIRNLTTRSKPQVKKGDTRRYGCVYTAAQILYWGYMVPDKTDEEA